MVPISAVVAPDDRTVLDSLDPVDLTLRAEAFSGLRDITLNLDGNLLTSFSFPDASVTGFVTTTTWTPAPDLVDGAHIFQSTASDWAEQVQTEFFPITLFLDTQLPTVDISPTVFTSTQQLSTWGVTLGGPVSDLAGISEVQVALQDNSGQLVPAAGPPGAHGNPWNPAVVVGDRWSYPWRPDAGSDGKVYTVVVQASDLAGHTVQAIQPVTVDTVPPAPVSMTLSYVNSLGVLTPITDGQTISDVLNPTLLLSWTSATDGSGLRSYYVGLSQQDPPDLASLSPVSPNGLLEYNLATAEAQSYTAYVVSEDAYGNLSWNRFGPIYIDSPQTPDLIALPKALHGAASVRGYHSWLVSGASQIGVDRILSSTLGAASPCAVTSSFISPGTRLRCGWPGSAPIGIPKVTCSST